MTDDEKQEILDAIKGESQSVDELEEVESLDNVKSLPAMRGEDVVSVPISLLGKAAEDAAATATEAATKATEAAATASASADGADTAAAEATAAAEKADAAAEKATDAASASESRLTTLETLQKSGYRLMGVATPSTEPGTPAFKATYLATTAGTYTNFHTGMFALSTDGTQTEAQLVLETGEAAFLLYDGYISPSDTASGKAVLTGGWSKQAIPLTYQSDIDTLEKSVTALQKEVTDHGTESTSHHNAHDSVTFGGIMEGGITIETVGLATTPEASSVLYSTSQKGFVLAVSQKYYNSWTGQEKYMDGNTPYTDKIYIDGSKNVCYRWNGTELVAIGGSGQGSGFYNVTQEQPLESGYYTLATAVAALANADIDDDKKAGMIITFEESAGVWADYRFVGSSIESFLLPASWEEYGGGKVKGVSLNGTAIEPDAGGNVAINIDTIEVDSTLSGDSTNPVQNKAVNAAIEELKNPQFNSDVENDDDGSTVTLTTQSGQQVARFKVQGGGSGGTTTSKIVLSASIDKTKVKEGGSAELKWYYNHVNSDGAEDGVTGDITVTVKRGSVTLYEQTTSGVTPTAAAHSITLDAWLKEAGTLGVYVKATANDNGVAQTKSYYVSVSVVSLSLTLTNAGAIASAIASGGYKDSETVEIAYAVKGSGTKVVSMYVDGNGTPATQTVGKSGTTNGSFTIAARNLSSGRHVIQIVAENDDLLSESTYIDILKAGGNAPFIGLYFTCADGTIFTADYLTPTVRAEQYESSTFQYIVYDPSATPASMYEYQGGELVKTYSVARALQDYTARHTSSGDIREKFTCGTTEYTFTVSVSESTISVSKATAGLSLELLAAGRSNEEANPGTWESNGVKTTFTGFDWKSSGWSDNALVLKNGARIEVGSKIFDEAQDPAAGGKTIEMEFKISNVLDYDTDIISCIYNGKGFRVKGNKASMLTGSSVTYTDEDGKEQERTVGVEKIFASDMDVKLALVIGKRSEYRLMELYINGTREKADVYNTTDNFVQEVTQGITVDSTAADVELRSIRVYDRALSDDEEVDNYIVDRKTTQEMLELYEKNDILNDNGEVDITKLLQKGKAVVRIIREGGLDEVNSTNNKKTDFLSTVIFHSPFGPEWDFKIEGCYIRIQGTSSTKYPRKNYRIYLLKPGTAKFYRKDSDGNWVLQEDFKGWPNTPGDKEAPLICLKGDYSDSSMTLNTGGARLFDAMMRGLGLLTPPQEVDSAVRQAINGFPCDVFNSESEDGAIEYYGQYNFNNDKSKSSMIFGHSDIGGFDFSKTIALEFLNNSSEVGQFQAAGSADSDALKNQMAEKFDDGLEFNFPEDCTWSDIDTKVPGAQAGLLRLFGWIYDCVQECVKNNGLDLSTTDYKTISLFKSSKFKSELADYFPVSNLLTWYLWTDYFMSVDQRVKNMIMRTWDLIHWFITYYDGDTGLGKRNDSFIAYLYTITRETWDSDKSKYAFEGHNSWLWCLVLANFEEELKECARKMRNMLTNTKVLEMLNEKQMGNWCERAYNKSGEFKYIEPATKGVRVIKNGVETDGVTYPFIYALDGTNYSHRLNTILNRFALLDAKYGCDSFKDDNVEMYLSRASSDATGIVKVTANNIYYFDWNTKNGSHSDLRKAEAGETVSLEFTGAITVNDPVDLYGASQMAKLDMTGIAGSLQNGINLNKATVLQEIDASSTKACTQAWWFNFENCLKISKIDCTNQQGVKTGTSSSTEFDVSNQTKLATLRLGGTKVRSVEIAEGAPLTECVLPETLTVLKLSYLPSLTMDGLTVQSYDNVETFIFTNCPSLDWQALLGRCANVKRIRVEGISMEDDGTFLAKYKGYKGVDADGNAVGTCQLVGDIHLTSYLDDSLYEEYKQTYPSLNIHQPECTLVRSDDVADPANLSNLDNKTGYAYGTAYSPSGHVSAILSRRHRCLVKRTGDGEVTVFPLHDSNSNYFADAADVDSATPAVLTGAQGQVMLYEPHYWYKGVNDFLGRVCYSAYSSLEACPAPAACVRLGLAGLKVREGWAVRVDDSCATLSDALEAASGKSCCQVPVSGYRMVRWPSLKSIEHGAVFCDTEGNVVKRSKANTGSGIADGMYCFTDIPEAASTLAFTILDAAAFDYVLLSESDRVEDMEPDWVEHPACLTGVYKGRIEDDLLLSVSGVMNNYGFTESEARTCARNLGKGFQVADYEMHKDVANLFYAKYGDRNSQLVCGPGSSNPESYNVGQSDATGMQDTRATAVDGGEAPSTNSDGSFVGGGAYVLKAPGDEARTDIHSPVTLGYEDWYKRRTELVEAEYSGDVLGSPMPDGTVRRVPCPKSWAAGYPRHMYHGRYMDVTMVDSGGSGTTYFCDYQTFAGGGQVLREAGSSMTIGMAYFYGRDVKRTNISFRLAFRGAIKVAASVAEFLAIEEKE